MSQVYLLPGLLSSAECETAISFFPAPNTASVNKDEKPQITSLRRSRASFLIPNTDEKRALVKKLEDVMDHANRVYYHYDLAGHEALQLAEYAEGDNYGWHLDLGPGKAALRKLSASVQLSAPENYDGGDLELWNTPPADRSQGTVIIFPSFVLHRVAPVTRGLRRSLVMWGIGATPFR